MNFEYCIANRHWRFETDYPLIDNEESEKFKVKKDDIAVEWICHAKAVDHLPIPSGTLMKETKEQRVYYGQQCVWVELLSRESDEAWFLSKYSLEDESEAQLWILNDKRPYTARVEHLWSAVNFPGQLLKKEILMLHSAVIEYNQKAILFLAPSSTGKSTQASLWEKYRGAKQLNGDKAGIRISEGMVKACGLPFCGTSGICEVYDLPVAAVVILSQAKENSIVKLSGMKALIAVMKNCYGHVEIPGCSDKIFQLLMKMIDKVSVYSLACTPDELAVKTLEKCLQEE